MTQRISRAAAYGLAAVAYVAKNSKDGPVMSKEIADTYDFPLAFLLKIMQQMVMANILRSKRGPRGGFILCNKELALAIDAAVFPEMQGGPLMHVIAAKAVAFNEAMQPEFVFYQQAILDNALALATELKQLGLRLISGGTDNHLVLVDLVETGVTGKQAEEALGEAGIVINRNAVPFTNTHSPRIAGGIRLGTPAVTTRGFGTEEMKRIAALIVNVIGHIDDLNIQKQVREEVCHMCQLFPVPGIDN